MWRACCYICANGTTRATNKQYVPTKVVLLSWLSIITRPNKTKLTFKNCLIVWLDTLGSAPTNIFYKLPSILKKKKRQLAIGYNDRKNRYA
jgi:hypothetical protein